MFLSRACGGLKIHIPKNARGTQLEWLIGSAAAAALAAAWGGDSFTVPLAPKRLAHWLKRHGRTRSQIVRILRVSDGTLRRWGI